MTINIQTVHSQFYLGTNKHQTTEAFSKNWKRRVVSKLTLIDFSSGYTTERTIFNQVSIELLLAPTAYILAPLGCCKSAMLRLLFRLYRLIGSKMLIDGQDIQSLHLQSLRRRMGVVLQDTVLFNITVRYNIAYGRLSASKEGIINASK